MIEVLPELPKQKRPPIGRLFIVFLVCPLPLIGSLYRDKPIVGSAVKIIIGTIVGHTADIDSEDRIRKSRHDYPDRRSNYDESVMMASEETPVMEKEMIPPVGKFQRAMGNTSDD
jgi:hypothetical protein